MKLSDKLAAAGQGTAEGNGKATSAPPPSAGDNSRTATTPTTTAKATTAKATTAKATTAKATTAKAKDEQGTASRWHAAKRTVREAVVKDLVPRLAGPAALTGDALEDEVMTVVDRTLRQEDLRISVAERRCFVKEVLADILGYGPLDELLADPSVTEVMCNDYDEIWIERAGRIEPTPVSFTDREHYRAVIDRIVSAVGRRVDESSPMVDARLPDGSRVNVIVPPIAVHGPCLTIRRFSEDPFSIQDLIGFGSLSDDLAVVLEACVRGELNILVSGGTATGKTTFLNVLSSFIPQDERIITIEDAAELQLQQPHVVTLEARPANAEGQGQVTIRALVRNALRMRPDRIVVGECRGAEALDMLQAMNTGHEGSLTTLHANSPRDALSRLEMLVLMAGMELPEKAVREQIAAAVDLIIQVQRLPDGARKIVSVQEVHGMEGRTIVLQEIFAYEPKLDAHGRYVGTCAATGLRPRFLEKLEQHGIEIPAHVLRSERGAPKPRAATRAGGRSR